MISHLAQGRIQRGKELGGGEGDGEQDPSTLETSYKIQDYTAEPRSNSTLHLLYLVIAVIKLFSSRDFDFQMFVAHSGHLSGGARLLITARDHVN